MIRDARNTNIVFTEPSTTAVLGQVSDCSLEDFQAAIKSADAAQPAFFESTTGTKRGQLLRKWNDLILENIDDSTFPSW